MSFIELHVEAKTMAKQITTQAICDRPANTRCNIDIRNVDHLRPYGDKQQVKRNSVHQAICLPVCRHINKVSHRQGTGNLQSDSSQQQHEQYQATDPIWAEI